MAWVKGHDASYVSSLVTDIVYSKSIVKKAGIQYLRRDQDKGELAVQLTYPNRDPQTQLAFSRLFYAAELGKNAGYQ